MWIKTGRGEFIDIPSGEIHAEINLPENQDLSESPRNTENLPAELLICRSLGDKSLSDRFEECRKEGAAGIPVDELLNYMDGAALAIDYLNSCQNAWVVEQGSKCPRADRKITSVFVG